MTSTSTPKKPHASFVRPGVEREISKGVIRQKLNKFRHLVVEKAISPDYLDALFPQLLQGFEPQHVVYNGGVANVKNWKISCYLEVMEGGVPCTNPNLELLKLFSPLLQSCNDLFLHWYRQQHACNNQKRRPSATAARQCQRLMTFVTRYTPAPGENALLKHVDGAGKVDGSIVVALPTEDQHSFVGHGGGLTVWYGKKELHYDTRSGDVAFLDKAVWHQADPISKGIRWALVIFYKIIEEEDANADPKETDAGTHQKTQEL